jgi:hypothetical protein
MNKPLQYRDVPTLDPTHDGRHALRDLPLERESIPYLFIMPEHDLAAFSYTWVNKDHRAGAAFAVFGKGAGDAPIAEWVDDIAVPQTANFDDWRVGPIHLQQDLKLKSAHLAVNGKSTGIEATFEALHPAYAYGFHPDGCPDYTATNRLEQQGRVSGVLRLGAQKLAFSGMGIRDHSWGTRDWQVPQHWKWLHAQAGECCVHFWQLHARGKTDLRGYVYRDAVLAEVRHVEVDFDLFDDYRQRSITALVVDNLGRQVRVEGAHFAHFPLIPGPHTTLNEGAMRCSLDGEPGVGWSEFMWPTAYLDYMRGQSNA